jgi:hypothetical protein
MAKNVKILLVTGISIDTVDMKSSFNDLVWIVGYFTNLKELYKNFEIGNIQSYSTICSHLKKQGYYTSKDIRFWYRRNYQRFNELTIREFVTNRLYSAHKVISLNSLLAKEVSNIDLQIGMNLTPAVKIDMV